MIYQYSINEVNLEKLREEIESENTLPEVSSATFNEGTVYVEFNDALSGAQEVTLASVVSNHTAAMTLDQSIDAQIYQYKLLGRKILDHFARENIKLGITQSSPTGPGYLTRTGEVIQKGLMVKIALESGSVDDALARLLYFPTEDKDATFLTNERLLFYVNWIQKELNLPLSSSLALA